MSCPYLAYRTASDDRQFDEARAYCTAADRFVQPMRADICNDRYDLAHDRDCEIYREHAPDDPDVPDPVGDAESTADLDRKQDTEAGDAQ